MRVKKSYPPGETGPALAMITPALIGLAAFIALPFVLAIALSATNLRMGSPLPTRFIGVENYIRLWGDAVFHRALLNNALFAAVVVPVQTAVALGLATLLNIRLRGITILRTCFFLPVVFPMALVAVIWQLIYAPGPTGFLNSVLMAVTGGAFDPVDYLHNERLALPAIMLFSIWQGVGFQMVVLLAGLQSIPRQLYEAAEIDGANALQRFLFVTIPQLRNPLIFTALVTTILAFRLFDQVQILTRGGPNNATTTVMYETVRSVFERQQVGLASAMTVVFFIIVLIVTLGQRLLVKPESEIS